MGYPTISLDMSARHLYLPPNFEVPLSRFLLFLTAVGCSQTYSSDDKNPAGTTDDGFVEGDTDTGTVDDTAGDTDTDADTDADTDTDTDTDTDSGTNTDTGEDTDTGTTAGSCPSSVSEMVWVVQTLEVTTSRAGLDLDGDGTGDNQLAVVRDALNSSILSTFPTSPVVLAWQMWDVEDWCDDPAIVGAFLSPSDDDGDHTDDYSGTEAFNAGDQIDASGHAVENGAGAITGGTYTFTFASGEFYVGGFTLTNATPVIVEGTANESANTGKFAFGLSVTLMEEIAVAEGYDPALAAGLADLDTDGDGKADAISVTFDFTAVPATVY